MRVPRRVLGFRVRVRIGVLDSSLRGSYKGFHEGVSLNVPLRTPVRVPASHMCSQKGFLKLEWSMLWNLDRLHVPFRVLHVWR